MVVIVDCAGTAYNFHMQFWHSDFSRAKARGLVRESPLTIHGELDAIFLLLLTGTLQQTGS